MPFIIMKIRMAEFGCDEYPCGRWRAETLLRSAARKNEAESAG